MHFKAVKKTWGYGEFPESTTVFTRPYCIYISDETFLKANEAG
jgi:hypothetical protein